MSDTTDFFRAGGTLDSDAPSYVPRRADRELYDRLTNGEFCYVLTARQMGKSSLMARTAARLRREGISVVIIDLSQLGKEVTVDQWYLSLLSRTRANLRLNMDVEDWWNSQQNLTQSARFAEFLRRVVLESLPPNGRVVFFIDEIDTTLRLLTLRDDFFATLRALYNERATDPTYARLSFVLLGVADPAELISDATRTPFNIAQRIPLRDLVFSDAQVLREGLEQAQPASGHNILYHIFQWTDGHPYLTQRLCELAAHTRDELNWDEAAVESLVSAQFFADGSNDRNLQFIRDRITEAPTDERKEMLALYAIVLSQIKVEVDPESAVQQRLELTGLVKAERNQLKVRNKIYQRAFDSDWLRREQLAIAEQVAARRHRGPTWLWVMLALVVLAAGSTVGYLLYLSSRPPVASSELALQAALSIRDSADANIRRAALATLFRLSYTQQARDEFFALRLDEQQALISTLPQEGTYSPSAAADLALVVRGLWGRLDLFTDGDPLGHQQLFAAMIGALAEANQFEMVAELSGVSALSEQGQISADNTLALPFATALAGQAVAATSLAAAIPPLRLPSAPENLLLYRVYTSFTTSPPDPAQALNSLEALARLQAEAQQQALPLELPTREPAAAARLATADAAPSYTVPLGTSLGSFQTSGYASLDVWFQDTALREYFLQNVAAYPSLSALPSLVEGLIVQATAFSGQTATVEAQQATAQAQQATAQAQQATAQAQQATAQALLNQQAATGEALTATALAPSPTPTPTPPPPTLTRIPTRVPVAPTRAPANPRPTSPPAVPTAGDVPVPVIPGG